jgi:hypothetical protein
MDKVYFNNIIELKSLMNVMLKGANQGLGFVQEAFGSNHVKACKRKIIFKYKNKHNYLK